MANPIRVFTGMVLFILAFGAFAQNNSNDQQSEKEVAKVLQPITVTGYGISEHVAMLHSMLGHRQETLELNP